MKIKASEAVLGRWYECEDGIRWISIKRLNAKDVMFYNISRSMVWLNENNRLTHLPDCTGWDWQPPKPEKQYRAFASFEVESLTGKEQVVWKRYRAFVSFQEWWPHRERWYRSDHVVAREWISPDYAEGLFKDGAVFLNDDGSNAEPFGMEVSE